MAEERDGEQDESSTEDEQKKTLERNRKRVAPIDTSKLTEEETTALEQRRAYNRQCAAKARKRSKDLIVTLQAQVEDLTKEKAELQRSNDVMRAQMELLEQQNRTLLMNQRQAAPNGVVGNPNPFLLAQTLPGIPFIEAIANQARMMAAPGQQQIANSPILPDGKASEAATIAALVPAPVPETNPAFTVDANE